MENNDSEDENNTGSFVLAPRRMPVRIWESAIAIVSVISCFTVVFQAAFDGSTWWSIGLVYVCDLTYVLGMFSQLFIGFERNGVAVTLAKEIFLHRLRTNFIVDILSVAPFEIVSLATDHPDYFAAILRLNRVLRCYKLWYFCSKYYIVH